MTTPMIVIRHPETGGIAVQSQDQYDALYAARGWEPVAIDAGFASDVVRAPIADLSELDPDQLVRVYDAHIAQKPSDRKATLVALHADELRDLAKSLNLPAGGSKDDIADRIVTHENEAAQAASD